MALGRFRLPSIPSDCLRIATHSIPILEMWTSHAIPASPCNSPASPILSSSSSPAPPILLPSSSHFTSIFLPSSSRSSSSLPIQALVSSTAKPAPFELLSVAAALRGLGKHDGFLKQARSPLTSLDLVVISLDLIVVSRGLLMISHARFSAPCKQCACLLSEHLRKMPKSVDQARVRMSSRARALSETAHAPVLFTA